MEAVKRSAAVTPAGDRTVGAGHGDRAEVRRESLELLDGALGRIRRLWDVPGVKQWFQAHLDLDDIDATMYRTLRAVRVSADPSVNGIAATLRVDASTASRFVERAVEAGLVRRSVAAHDRRRSSLELTDAGRDRLLDLRDVRVAFLAELTAGWSADDLATIVGLLDRLDDGVGRLRVDRPDDTKADAPVNDDR